jgi:dienelactone hydrolase
MARLSAALLVAVLATPTRADDLTRVLPAGEKSKDARLGPAKTLDDYFPFTPPATKEEWSKRRKELREQLLVANGLWPMPDKTPLNPTVHGKVEKDGYTIEKVFFASTPGHYVTGNLYRPAKADGKRPGVLFAHGHWNDGRFHDAGPKAAELAVQSKAEADLDRGRFFMQAIPVQLARMGFVVFQYDMVGYADSTAIPHRDGFRDVAAELRLQSFMGLQTWNSIRALDFLESLPDVDRSKLGITGASGGGTQTFILAAVDDRVAAAFPAVMVSTAMQGGCVCENASYLRVGTGNVEMAGLFAPKPLAMSGADDWTREIMTRGYPELRQLYKLLGAEEKVAAKAWLEYKHNYNQHAREFMYAWFNRHLAGKDGPVAEQPYKPTPPKELSVYDADHPRPTDELDAGKLRERMAKASDDRLAKLMPKDEKSLAEFRSVVGTALRAMVGGRVPEPGTVTVSGFRSEKGPGGVSVHKAILGRKGEGDAVPAVGVIPDGHDGAVVVWVHPKGKASLIENGDWAPAVKALLGRKIAVLGIDVLHTGEQAGDPLPVDKPMSDQKYAGFFFGYNRALPASRARDVLTAVANLRDNAKAKAVHVVGWGELGPVAVLAKALAGDAVAKTAADLDQFAFERVDKLDHPMMLPGAVKYGGLPAFLGLCAPGEVLAHNHKGTASGQWSKAAYDAAGAADKLTRSAEKMAPEDVAAWLAK